MVKKKQIVSNLTVSLSHEELSKIEQLQELFQIKTRSGVLLHLLHHFNGFNLK